MPLPSSTAAISPRVELRQLTKHFGRFPALDAVNLAFAPGEFVAVLGRNGAGKTTLLRLLAGLQRPSAGELFFDGQPAARLGPDFKRRLGFVGHETLLYDELTCEENLRFFARLYGLHRAAARIHEALAEVGLEARATSLVRQLSRGLKQRLSLARARLHQPDLLLLDEPATGLDAPTRTSLHARLAADHRAGRTVVASSHDLGESLQPATRIVLLEAGRVAFDGPNAPERADEMRARMNAAS
jgi:heme ABC exporter ATP-binding subunit CcmA